MPLSHDPPLVTVAIPLYRSKPFLDIILANLDALDYPNLEVIISDRHSLDDALAVLKGRYGDDPRFGFLQANDELDWIAHYNLLLKTGTGDYFVWMPHDDSYPSSYIPLLAECLNANPDALLAFGRMEKIGLDGEPFAEQYPPPPDLPSEWSTRAALRLFRSWHIGIPFRGLFRRQPIVAAELYIRRTYDTALADCWWVFGVALLGRLCYVPEAHCCKRLYPWSRGAAWRYDLGQIVDSFLVLQNYVNALIPRRTERAYISAVLLYQTCLQAAARLSRFVPAPRRLRRLLRRGLLGPQHAIAPWAES